jgi:hypothetical protein
MKSEQAVLPNPCLEEEEEEEEEENTILTLNFLGTVEQGIIFEIYRW